MRFLAIPTFVFIIFFHHSSSAKGDIIYNVQSFGAISDGQTDCTHSFLSAWVAACASVQSATVYVAPGRYLIGSAAAFAGQNCQNNDITMRINGTLVAPSDYNVLGGTDYWMKFERAKGLSIYGGALDGQGAGLWGCKNHRKNCPNGAASLVISKSNNVVVNGLISKNSQFFHIIVDSCTNIKLLGLTISAPGNSPNTDGIHIQSSSGVAIMNSLIGTGDDCISLAPGCSNIWCENINCGPGHGISIGSLGSTFQEAGVQNVTVKTVTFTGTANGARIKTFANPSKGFVQGVLYQNVTMVNVKNPIIIDQNYCPRGGKCSSQGSGVRISNVTYQDIHGTSASKVAVNFHCGENNPCSGITLEDVNISCKVGQPWLHVLMPVDPQSVWLTPKAAYIN